MRFISLIILFTFSYICNAQSSLIDLRLDQEDKSRESSFAIIPHKPNYIMPFNFNDKIKGYNNYSSDGNEQAIDSRDWQEIEMKFQVSFKMPIWVDIADLPISFYAAYTQVSFWQAYNAEHSSPFRETNYEPEAFLLWRQDKDIGLGWKLKLASFAFTHQSNGRGDPISRSWNRVSSSFSFEKDNLTLTLNPWHRIKESASEDNNPDLLDYYGHGKINAIYKAQDHTFVVTSRNNLESGFSKGSVELSWSFPLHGKLRGYLQVFSGYGNSMIEYNKYTNTVGFGIALTDWL